MDYNLVIVLDLAIYAKALDIVWKLPAQSQQVVLRVWAFHVASNLKCFAEAHPVSQLSGCHLVPCIGPTASCAITSSAKFALLTIVKYTLIGLIRNQLQMTNWNLLIVGADKAAQQTAAHEEKFNYNA